MATRPHLPLLIAAILFAAPAFAQQAADIDRVMGGITAEAGARYGTLTTVNGSIRVEAGASTGDVATVNGSIRVAENATTGTLETVNGSIRVSEGSRIGSAETVNGSIRLARGVASAGDLETVNGSIFSDSGSSAEDVTTVNGSIGLVRTRISGDVETVGGDVTVGIGSHVGGGLKVHKPSGNWMPLRLGSQRPQRIVIGPDAVVTGALVFEREVKLYVHRSARIGSVSGATPILFDTPVPPAD